MTLYYNGVDITDQAKVLSCTIHDCAGQHLDSIDIEFDEPGAWFLWDPQPDDTVRVVDDVYDTGSMYVTGILPYEDKYRIMATACPTTLRAKGTQAFADKTLTEIGTAFATSAGMTFKLFGLDDPMIPYAMQKDETGIGFLSRVCGMYGALMKCMGKMICAVSIDYANKLESNITLNLTDAKNGVNYQYHPDMELGSVFVMSGYTSHTAVDDDAKSAKSSSIFMPVLTEPQATMIAEGILRMNNLQVEDLWIDLDYSPGLTAMGRADIEANNRIAGKWLIGQVDHDLIARSSSVRLWRCREGIA